jgi:hypothetical protein
MTERKGQTKRQHYVPRFILRRFSDDQKNVAILLMADGRYVSSGPLKYQCYEDYFYGEDQILEQSFAKNETQIAGMLGDLDKGRLERLSEDDLVQLRLFVHYQLFRTRGAAEQSTEFKSAFVREMATTTAKLNKDAVDEETIASLRLQNPGDVTENIWLAAKSSPALQDLDVKFLLYERPAGFVIGDHPVVACNQFAEHHPVLSRWPNITGAVSKGLQVFLPLSPSVTLCLYDPGTYAFDVGRRVCNVGPRDVRFLNSAQAVNAWRCVFLNGCRSDEKSRQMLLEARSKHVDVHKPQVFASHPFEKADGTVGQLVAVAKNDVRVCARYSFLRVIEGDTYEHYDAATIPPRSKELVDFLRYYSETLERAEQDARKQGTELTEEQFQRLALEIAKERGTRRLHEELPDLPDGVGLHRRGLSGQGQG